MIGISVSTSFDEYVVNRYVQVHTTPAERWNYYATMYIGPARISVDPGLSHELASAMVMMWYRATWTRKLKKLYQQQSERLIKLLKLNDEGVQFARSDGKAEVKSR